MPALELITSGNEFRFNSAGPRDQVKLESAAELRLESDRLDLVPCSPQACLASLQGPRVLSRLAGIEVPPTWPPRELTDALALYARGLDGGDSRRGWGIWLLVSKVEPTLVGSAGFKGRPDEAGCVEIGYGIEPRWRRHGLATEAVTRLSLWAWEQGVQRIVAECDERNSPSAGVLRGVGMRPYERRGKMQWWEFNKPC